MIQSIDGDVDVRRNEAAMEAVHLGAIAGAAGGLAEIGVVVSYCAAIGSDPAIVARGITKAVGLGSLMPASPAALGISIHMTIAVILGIALAFVWQNVRSLRLLGASPLSFVLAALAGVWAVNFLLVLPVISPAFVHLLPYPVSLASKLLFGAAAAVVLRLSDVEMTKARSVQFMEATRKILASAAV